MRQFWVICNGIQPVFLRCVALAALVFSIMWNRHAQGFSESESSVIIPMIETNFVRKARVFKTESKMTECAQLVCLKEARRFFLQLTLWHPTDHSSWLKSMSDLKRPQHPLWPSAGVVPTPSHPLLLRTTQSTSFYNLKTVSGQTNVWTQLNTLPGSWTENSKWSFGRSV